MEVIGVDIDLRRCHAWSNKRGRLLYKAREPALYDLLRDKPADSVAIVECASPVIYGLTEAMLHNKLRWMIYNMYVVGQLSSLPGLLYSPSSTWKHGWGEDEMMDILDITGDNHDIRQCRAMVALHAMHPEDWVTYTELVEGI